MKHRLDSVITLTMDSKKTPNKCQESASNYQNSVMNDLVKNSNMDRKNLNAKPWKKCSHADMQYLKIRSSSAIVSVLISKATGKIKKTNVLLSLQVCYMRSNEMLESKRIVDV